MQRNVIVRFIQLSESTDVVAPIWITHTAVPGRTWRSRPCKSSQLARPRSCGNWRLRKTRLAVNAQQRQTEYKSLFGKAMGKK
jgi:hypothetical protein